MPKVASTDVSLSDRLAYEQDGPAAAYASRLMDGQHQVTAAAALLTGFTATLQTQHVDLVAEAGLAGALHQVAGSAQHADRGWCRALRCPN